MRFEKDIPLGGSYDVIVCGGGFAGFAAALAAAREGADTLLIERNFALGGVGTLGLVNHLLGARYFEDGTLRDCVGGIFSTLERDLLAQGACVDVHTLDPDLNPHGWKKALAAGPVFDKEIMKLTLERMLSEAGAKILYGTDILDTVTEGTQLRGVIVHNKSGLSYLQAHCFIDATGDGDVAAMAGCEFDKGDSDGGLAAASLEMHVENVDSEALTAYMRDTGDVRFKQIIARLQQQGEWSFPYSIFISVRLMRDDVYMINTIRQTDVDGTDARSVSDAILRGRAENLELLRVMRAHFPGFSRATVREIAPCLGVRETRRIRTHVTLRVEDIIQGAGFPDTVALSGYGWDMPNPKDPSLQPYHGVARARRTTPIPYRTLLPVGVDNLLLAGRCIGVEREALGTVRVMAPCIAMGEAAGIAAALSVQAGIHPANLNIQALRQKITAHGGIL